MDATEAAWTPLWDQAKAMGPDPELADLSNEEVEAEVRHGAAQIAALTCRWLLHVTELVVRGIWVDDGQRSPGAWLSWRVGVAPSTAREYVRVGLALRNAPKIRARFAAGTISYSKVRAITRVAAPETEDQLLDLADAAPAGQVERIIAGCRHQLAEHERWADGPPALDDADPRDFQRLQRTPDTVEYRIRVSAADAAAVDARLARLVEREDRQAAQPRLRAVPDTPDDEGQRGDTDDAAIAVPIGVRRAQAFLDSLAVAVADDAPDRSGDDDHLVVVHVDQADLVAATAGGASAEADPVAGDARTATDGSPGAGASAEAPTTTPRPSSPRRRRVVTGRGRGMSLPRAVIARLACDADLRLAAMDDTDDPRGHPADIGRRSRKVPPDLRRALVLRDRHCRFPGCHNTRGLHAHHVVHWALGGPTDLANLLLLCPFHHRFVHDAGWELRPVAPADGRWTFHAPDSSAPRHPAPPLDGASAEAASEVIDDPHPQCLEPPWWNGAYDLSLTISVIADALEHLEPNVPDRGPHPWLADAA